MLAAAMPAFAQDAGGARREIQDITRRLNDLSAWFSDAQKQQREAQKEIKGIDDKVARASRDIRALSTELETIRASLADLGAKQRKLEVTRNAQAQLIANHLAAAYRLQGQDIFKMFLNQENPDRFDRMMRYHQYFSMARTETLATYEKTIAELAQNSAAISERESTLAARQRDLDTERSELVTQRRKRERLLASLDSQMKDRSKERERLTQDRGRLEQLLVELTRRTQALDGTFATTKGKLPWPVQGKVEHGFGEARAGGHLKWHGVFIAAKEGTTVTAVHRGRVAFADWLRGFGLLTIVDHGNGFMTLYAHADVIYKQVGDWVEGGETIATAGRSGGQTESGLYFEVRSKGTPVNPRGWLRAP
jgi:septal ring factor EnvC (AmiA/AmiB activator)